MAAGKFVQVVITGDKEVDAMLASIHPTMQRKAIRRAADEATRLVARHAIANAPVDSGGGQIEASIKRRTIRRSRTRLGRSVVVGGPFEDRADSSIPFYAAFVELGTKLRRHKSGKFVGQIDIIETETPFLRPALYDHEREIWRLFFVRIRESIRQLKKHGKLLRRRRGRAAFSPLPLFAQQR
jgi:HK97 gp10 family phage protein